MLSDLTYHTRVLDYMEMITLGVIGDTHIPDRTSHLHPGIVPLFHKARVQAILHTGDICVREVLTWLEEIAPVFAVRGNRDWLALRELPLNRELAFGGVTIGLTHGHGGWRQYIIDKPYYLFYEYQHERLFPRLLSTFQTAQAIVFGHGHLPLNTMLDGKLLFNPGFPVRQNKKKIAPTVGLLHINGRSEISGRLVELD